jgi:hypothetical protein
MMMWTPACYLFRWPFGRLETVFPSRHVRSLPPISELGRVSESQVQERLSGAIDIVTSEALRDRLPAGDSAGRARPTSERDGTGGRCMANGSSPVSGAADRGCVL